MEKNSLKDIIDFHAHILPNADHGSDGLRTTRAQLQEAIRAKVGCVVATPHFYPHEENVSLFLERRKKAMEQLEGLEEQKQLRILQGAEVLLCPNMDKMPGLEELCIENTRILLLEMPFVEKWSSQYLETLERICKGNYCVVLAHIERYSLENAKIILERNLPVQINVSHIKSLKKRRIVQMFLQKGNVVAIGSDIHGRGREYRLFHKVIKKFWKQDIDIMARTRKLLEDYNL